jgi:uncharacterized protein
MTSTIPAIYAALVDDTVPASDCDCACAPPIFAQLTPPPPHAALQTNARLRTTPLDSEHSVVFVPSHSRVATMNAAALALLRRLAAPLALSSFAPREQDTLLEFYRLGLVQRVDQPPPAPAPLRELVAWLHVTNACPLRCDYCYLTKTDEGMSADVAHHAVAAVLRAASGDGYRRVLLKYAGGEASMNLPLVLEMHALAQRLAAADGIGVRGVVLSSGVGLGPARLVMLRDAGLRLMISLDGPQAFHDAQRRTLNGRGSYRAATAAIERAAALGLDLTVSVTITPASVAGLPEVIAWLRERDIHFTLNFYRQHDCGTSLAALHAEEQQVIDGMRACYRVLEHNLPRYSLLGCLLDRTSAAGAHSRACAAGDSYLVIDQRGMVAKCQMEIAAPLASIHEPRLLDVIRLDARGLHNLPGAEKEGCRECDWRDWCAGGCPVATYRATGRYDLRSPNCRIYRELFPDVIRLEGLRLLQLARQG